CVVTDQTEAVIPGVEVTAVNTATGVSNVVITNEAGAFSITNLLTPGTYRLTAALPGFQLWRAENIALGTNQTLRFNPVLEVEAAGTEVEVVVDAATILTTSSPTVGSALEEEQVTQLPLVGSNVLDLVSVLS